MSIDIAANDDAFDQSGVDTVDLVAIDVGDNDGVVVDRVVACIDRVVGDGGADGQRSADTGDGAVPASAAMAMAVVAVAVAVVGGGGGGSAANPRCV